MKKTKKWYGTGWGISLIVFSVIIVYFILYSIITNVPVISIKVNSENLTQSEIESIENIIVEDCPDLNQFCDSTTLVKKSYTLIDGKCIEDILLTENSFDCGYVVPCDLDACKSKDVNTCEGTTKVITSNFCDDKLGCTNKIIKDENSTDCGYLFSGKYSLEDVNLIKELAKECKFNLEICASKDYEINKIYAGKSKYGIVNPNTLETTYPKIYVQGYIRTPFIEALIFTANKDKLYESYTDEDIIKYLSLNQFLVILNPQYDTYNIFGMYSSLEEPIGNLKTIVIDYNGQNFIAKDSTSTYTKSINSYENLFDKSVQIIIVGDYREIKSTIDLSKYK